MKMMRMKNFFVPHYYAASYSSTLRLMVCTGRCFATIEKKKAELLKASRCLPRLPVPKLEDTLDKYLRSVIPFLSPEELKRTEKVTEEFKNEGVKLQQYLFDKAGKKENWVEDWWLDTYLTFRKPVVCWSSPGLVFPLQTFNSTADQLTYTANIISAALRYKEKIDRGDIKQDYSGQDALDMSQYFKIFATCRIPKPERDELRFEDPNDVVRHIVIVHNNNYFSLKVYHTDGSALSVEELYDNLLAIIESSLEKVSPVGLLTTDNRDNWCKAYRLLKEDEANARSIEEIEKSLFLVCLDNPCEINDSNDKTKAAYQTVHGGGPNCNGGNRWFDKTIQFIVNRNGEVGLTYEHSPAEGQPIAVMMDFIVDHLSSRMELVDTCTTRNFKLSFESLPLAVNEKVDEFIQVASKNLHDLVCNLEMFCFTYSAYGKNFIKGHKLSPDSYIQMALQYAFFRLQNSPGAQYETASTRKFLHGRTETIRSCSKESVAFARCMLNSSASRNEKRAALQNAIDSHKKYTIQAMNGLGVDRHLMGLKLAAIEMGSKVPELFFDPAYIRSTNFRISTSQVASKCDGFMCYGPLVDDGYACCYNPREESVNFGTSAFRLSKETNINFFKDSLVRSLDEMHNLLYIE